MVNAMQKIGDRLVDLITGKPWLVLTLALAALFGAAAGMGHIQRDFTYRSWFEDDDPLIVQFDQFERRFGNDESVMVAVHSPSGIFDADSAAVLQELTDRLWRAPEVIRVDSLTNFNWVHAEGDDILVEPLLPKSVAGDPAALAARRAAALAHDVLPGFMVSADANTTLVFATLSPSIGKGREYQPILAAVRGILSDLKGRGDHVFHLAGQPVINDSFREATMNDIASLMPYVLALTVIFLAILFRRVSGVVFPMLVLVFCIVGALGLAGWVGIPMNNLTSVVPQILTAIAISDTVHILASVYREIGRGTPRKEAVRAALSENFNATLLTCISTSLGFFTFGTATVPPIMEMGVLAGIGTIVAWLVTYLVAGPILAVVPLRVRPDAGADERAHGRAVRITEWVVGHRRFIQIGFALTCLLAVGVSAARLSVNSDPLGYFPPESALNQASTFIERELGGSIAIELVVESGAENGVTDPAFLRKADEFQTWVRSQSYVKAATSIVNIIKSVNRAMHADDPKFAVLPDTREAIAQMLFLYTMNLPQGMELNDRVTLKQDALRLTTLWSLHASKEVIAAIDAIEAKGTELGLKVYATGKQPLYQRMNPAVVSSFVTSILTGGFWISALLVVVFRSLKLGIVALIPNLAPMALGAAGLALIGKPLDIGTVIVFNVCLGITVDDTVHVLSHYNERRSAGVGAREAIVGIMHETAPALIATTAALVVAFGAFGFASFMPNRAFGILTAVILTIGLATELTLTPALLTRDEDARTPGPGA